MALITLKGIQTVKPSERTWQGVMSLSIFDLTCSIVHESVIYVYRRPPNNWLSPPEKIADTLKKSLSEALTHFYPLAGRLRWSGGGGGRLELHCNAMGVEFVEAEAHSELENFFGHDFSPSQKQRCLFPDIDHKYKTLPFEDIPPLLVQLTRFSCGGISLSTSLSQAVADGLALFHFFAEWARLARGEPLKTAPFLNRGVLGAGQPPRVSMFVDPTANSYPKLMRESESSDYYLKRDNTITEKLRLSKEEIEKVKKIANKGQEEVKIVRAYTRINALAAQIVTSGKIKMAKEGRPAGSENSSLIQGYSRYEALAAHIWRSVTKARSHQFAEQPMALSVPICSRNRIQPPLPWNYFGNAVCEVLPCSTAGELVSKPLGFTAGKIRAAIKNANSEFIWTVIDKGKNTPDLTWLQNLQSHLDGTASLHDPNLCLISWFNLPMYGLDFGWGKEIYMGPGEIEGEWAYLIECPSGDGSLILMMCLQTAHMESFKNHFYNDIV